MSNDDGNTPADSTVLTGRVKWFNNKAGFGFVTVILPRDNEKIGEDIFAHHTGISVSSEQYRYLVQGEYVNFTLNSTEEGEHKYQATNIGGLEGGMLMCETRNEQRLSRTEDGEEDNRRPRRTGGQRVRLRGAGVRDGEVWTLMKDDSRSRQNRGGNRRVGNRRTRDDEE